MANIYEEKNEPLTRQEITLAWLKVGWEPAKTGDRSAGACFENLGEELNARGMRLDIDELVAAVSFVWSVKFNKGQLLANKDLLRGAAIQPMDVCNVAFRFSFVPESLLDRRSAVGN